MELILDLHLHSHFSRATSKNSNLEGLYKWGKIKGINIIGTGDFTHPAWFAEIREKLEEVEPGLFKLKENLAKKIDEILPSSVKNNEIRFILTSEISTIYSKAGRVRKVHQLLVAPNFETVSAINDQLSRIGNLKSDGRPILGLDSKELLKICLATSKELLFIPAHIWTPWFSLFGSKSGFDKIEEAFEELTPEIKAIETGLSSDPFMNWRLTSLQNLAIISNSDAHSPEKLGREATILNCEMNYRDLAEAIKTNDQRIIGTIEFFPEEGKYHYDGHRTCNVRLSPPETKKRGGICPVCFKPLTVGVDYRVEELANHPFDYQPEKHKSVEYIIPLLEIIAELKKMGTNSKAVQELYQKAIAAFGSEFDILRRVPLEKIKNDFPELAYGLERMRQGTIYIEPGYDGVFGVIKLFETGNQRKEICGQMSLL
ncbi:MAG: endonuclease Q family protein [Patescibacteria group bacterium]|nr:endonuclease Q family protein [Patescibacteria group bacterium]